MRSQLPKSSIWHSRLDLETSLSILDSIATLTQKPSTQADFLRKVNLSLARTNEEDRCRELSIAASQAFTEIATSLISHNPSLHIQEHITRGFHNDIDTLRIIHSYFSLSSDFPAMHHGGLYCLASGDPVDVGSCGRAVADELASMLDKAGSDISKERAGVNDIVSQQARAGSMDTTVPMPDEGRETNSNAAINTQRRWYRRGARGSVPTSTNRTRMQSSLNKWRARLQFTPRSEQATTADQNTAATDGQPTTGEPTASALSRFNGWRRRRNAKSGTASAKEHRSETRSRSSVDAWLESTVGDAIAPPAVLESPPPAETDRTRLGGVGSVLLGSALVGGMLWAGARYLGRDDEA